MKKLILIAVFLIPNPIFSATYTVTNLNDAGAGSLRAAILSANGNGGADIINFQSGLNGTITLTSGQMTITDEVTINGPVQGVITIDGNNGGRIFLINSGVTANINNLSVTNGLVNTVELITHTFGLSEIKEAFKLREKHQPDVIHVMIDCEK